MRKFFILLGIEQLESFSKEVVMKSVKSKFLLAVLVALAIKGWLM